MLFIVYVRECFIKICGFCCSVSLLYTVCWYYTEEIMAYCFLTYIQFNDETEIQALGVITALDNLYEIFFYVIIFIIFLQIFINFLLFVLPVMSKYKIYRIVSNFIFFWLLIILYFDFALRVVFFFYELMVVGVAQMDALNLMLQLSIVDVAEIFKSTFVINFFIWVMYFYSKILHNTKVITISMHFIIKVCLIFSLVDSIHKGLSMISLTFQVQVFLLGFLFFIELCLMINCMLIFFLGERNLPTVL